MPVIFLVSILKRGWNWNNYYTEKPLMTLKFIKKYYPTAHLTAFLLSQLYLNMWNPNQTRLLSRAQDALEHPAAFLLLETESTHLPNWDNLLHQWSEKNPTWITVYIRGKKVTFHVKHLNIWVLNTAFKKSSSESLEFLFCFL